MRTYSHAWLGFGLVFFLLLALFAILPSRTEFLSQMIRIPSSLAVTLTELSVPTPNGTGSPPPLPPGPPARTPDRGPPDRAPEASPPPPAPAVSRMKSEPGGYTLDFGVFATPGEADQVETQLNQLGASTIRYRKRSDRALYALRVGKFRTPARARASMDQLRLRLPRVPLRKVEPEVKGVFAIVLDAHYPLREAVALARRLRQEGLTVRIRSTREAAPLFTLRLKETYDRKSAEEKSREFRNQGVPNAVVPVEPASVTPSTKPPF
ncbi:MAG: SPOR domain-containing protein [Candidatus Methylomirabilia bacterium]